MSNPKNKTKISASGAKLSGWQDFGFHEGLLCSSLTGKVAARRPISLLFALGVKFLTATLFSTFTHIMAHSAQPPCWLLIVLCNEKVAEIIFR